MKKRETIITLLIIVAIVVAAGVAVYLTSEEETVLTEADRSLGDATGFGYTDLDGNPVSLSAYDGTVRVVNSWASWCPFCVNELPDFASLAQEYASQDVVVLAINRKETNRQAKAFVEHVGNPEGLVFIQDPGDAFYDSIGGFTMPETIFYDRDGNIVLHKRGFMELAEMREHTETALAATQE